MEPYNPYVGAEPEIEKPAEPDKHEIEFASILKAIKDVKKYQMVCEIIWSALYAMKENPSLTIPQAMDIGYNEWIK